MHANPGSVLSTIVLLSAASTTACEDAQNVPSASFPELFEKVGTVVLMEPDSAPITGVRDFVATEDGRFVIIDRARPEIRVFDPDGQLIRSIGRFGDGPGEFRRPLAVAVDGGGRLLVADGENDLLTEFTADLVYDTAFRLPGLLANRIEVMGSGDVFAVVVNEPAPPHDFFGAVLGRHGSLRRGFHDIDPRIWTVPYWPSFSVPVGAAGENRIVLGNNLFYPFRMYDAAGELIHEFGTPPPFWREAGHPEAGAFMGVDGFSRMHEWLTNLTMVRLLGVYRDSAVMVVHAEPQPLPADFYASSDISLDIYDMDGAKVWEDIRVPGRILRVDRLVYVLEREPPDPWTVVMYQLRSQE